MIDSVQGGPHPTVSRGPRWWPTRDALRRLLVEPLVDTPAPDERRRAKLLALLALSQAILAALGALQAAVFAPEPMEIVVPPVLAAVIVYAIAYVLARRGSLDAAASIAIAVQIAVPLTVSALLPVAGVQAMSPAAWVSVALLTASATLGPRSVLLVGGVALASMIAMLSGRGMDGAVGEVIVYLVAFTAVVYVYARHRDGLEAARREQLAARNEELEQLRATLEERVEERTNEIARTAADLERALDAARASQETLLQTEKMAAVGRLTAGFAHELATPLAALVCSLDEIDTLRAEYARSIGDPGVTDEDHRAIAVEMQDATDLAKTAGHRAVTFVRGIRAHTRSAGARSIERFDAGCVVRDAVELLAHVARAASVRIAVEGVGTEIPIRGVPSRLNQAVTNLVINAIHASGEHRRGGIVRVVVARRGGDATIDVDDDGPGVPEGLRARVFEPLFTTKPYGKGTGLGLAIVREIARDELGGSVTIGSSAEGGARFTIRVPLAPEASDGA